MKLRPILTATLLLISALPALSFADNCSQLNAAAMGKGSPAQRLKKFFDAQWKIAMTEFPEFATYVGYPGQDDRLTDQSLGAIERRKKEVQCALKALNKIPRTQLTVKDRTNFDLFKRQLELGIEGDRFPSEYLAVNQLGGIQSDFADLLMAMPAQNKAQFENMLKRMEKFPPLAAQIEALLREGVKKKVVGVKMFMPKVIEQIDGVIKPNPEDSPLFNAFKEMPVAVEKKDQDEIRARAKELIQTKLYPALTRFREFMLKEYIPQARETTAWYDMPQGKEWYAFNVRMHTTTAKTPDELHELGLSEVKRITAAMEDIKTKVNYKGDLKAFNKFLLKDKQFYYKSADDLLNGYREIAKRIDPELPKMFKTLPRLTYGIKAVPEFKAAAAPGAYYEGGSLESGRPGYFVANTYDLPSRPKWGMETLTFHEAVPGHHFQIAIAQELGDMPNFRRYGGYTAFTEGWALYAESLGEEMGFYKDPYSMYGHLSDEMLRAVRLVVDTGLHAKGWSKQKALDFYRSSLPASDIESETEIDRYITWPGQALAYKVGQLKIKELREYAKAQLGDKFDVREFHDQILNQGAIPLDVLEKRIHEWTGKTRAANDVAKLY